MLSLAWLMHKPAVSSVIVGATSAKQLTDNLQSTSLELDEASFEALENISDKYRNGEPFAVYRLS